MTIRHDENRRGRADAQRSQATGREPAPDRVEEADRESFPASDPPAWTPVRGIKRAAARVKGRRKPDS